MLQKKIQQRKENLLIAFVLCTLFIFGQTAIARADVTVDTSIILNVHKSGGIYSLSEAIRVADGAKSGYTDDLQLFKGKIYNGNVVSFFGKSLGYFAAPELVFVLCKDNFSPTATDHGGCEDLPDGDSQLRVPYFPNGKYVDFYNTRSEKILTVDISSVATCNENNTCEATFENEINCPSDCHSQTPIIAEPTVSDNNLITTEPVVSNNNLITTEQPQKNNLFIYIVASIFFVITLGLIIFLWIRKRKEKQSTENLN